MDDGPALLHHVKAGADGVVLPVRQQHNLSPIGWVLLLYHLRTRSRAGTVSLEVARVFVETEFTQDRKEQLWTNHMSGDVGDVWLIDTTVAPLHHGTQQ